MKTRRIAADAVVYLILSVMAVLWISPILWLVLQSFSGDANMTSASLFLPNSWSTDPWMMLATNQVDVNGTLQAARFNWFGMITQSGSLAIGSFVNTIWVALLSMVIATCFTLCSAYAFSRLRFKGRTLMMRIILVIGLFPGFLGMIVIYWTLQGIDDTGALRNLFILALIYSIGAGTNYYVSKGFFDTISKQIDEAAMVDGATRFQIFYKIILPLSKPIVVNVALGAFMGPWGDYITSAYIMGPAKAPAYDNWTVARTLYGMLNDGDYTSRPPYWRTFCAGAVCVAIPTTIIFMFMQKYYVAGVTGGAVKG